MLINVGDMTQFSYSYSPKEPQPQEYIAPSSRFLSRIKQTTRSW